MLFNSSEFLIFFPVVTILYFLFSQKYRWLLLLISSCIFYMAYIPYYIIVLFIAIIIDYSLGIAIEKYVKHRKLLLIISILATCSLLFVFKYFNFFNENVQGLFGLINIKYSFTYSFILPIGLSFHTFQSLSYVIEVYKGRQKAERHFGIYALYVMFYPQLLAGPIERPQNLIPQFYEKHYFDKVRVSNGLKLMLWGMFKKVVVADNIAVVVNHIYGNLYSFAGVEIFIAIILFPIQMYCDFSGYSDIAIGSAQVMGIKLKDNFNRPLSARTTAEFWSRWHISLNIWFRDYIYIPIVMKGKYSKEKKRYGLFLICILSGFWHGAGWNFIAWGGLIGFYMIIASMTNNLKNKILALLKINIKSVLYKYYQIISTYMLLAFTGILFRVKDLSDIIYIMEHLVKGWRRLIHKDLIKGVFFNIFQGGRSQIIIVIMSIIFMILVHKIQKHEDMRNMFLDKPIWFRWGLYYIMVFSIIFLGEYSSSNQFIYFQF